MSYLDNLSLKMNLIRLALTFGRKPDKIITKPNNSGIYMRRWHVIPHNKWFNVYLHYFTQSDEDRALHDHPRWNMSWILEGNYIEVTPGPNFHNGDLTDLVYTRKFAGWKNRTVRKAEDAHRILLYAGKPVWTLFFVGKWKREWGFYWINGWISNDKFEAQNGCN